jgi:hypothetical protein
VLDAESARLEELVRILHLKRNQEVVS